MKYLIFILFAVIIFFQIGCHYDKPVLNQAICDTAIVTFSRSVQPILVSNCIVCHSGNNPPNGVTLDTYLGARAQVTSGKLLNVVMQTPGYDAMPKNGIKLNDCDISKIRIWIATGAPNN